jgi:group II intron reverse transcriptase/maturase
MPNEKSKEKLLCVDNLRHAEYYGLQQSFDELYAKSKNGEEFMDLMTLILSRENILLAYRNIKTNTGSKTDGTDGLTIRDIGRLPPDKVVKRVQSIVTGSPHGYRPKAVRRKDIPKPYDPTKTRPLGIPCIWDRLIQQCIKQVMEPICEAKFSENSYGFRPNRSVEHAVARTYQLLQLSHLHYVIEFDIKGFFDNVNHSKLIRQIWAMGIHDKHLIYVLRKILTAQIKMPNGTLVTPDRGTPQGGIISPLLANIVLNELDHWVDSQLFRAGQGDLEMAD